MKSLQRLDRVLPLILAMVSAAACTSALPSDLAPDAGDSPPDGIDESAPLVTQSFVSVTSWARPAPATPSAASAAGWRLVPFTTKAGLDAAMSNMHSHDYIYYAGTGVLTISNASSNGYVIWNKNPTGRVVINFGTNKSIWNTAIQSGNYVKFVYAGTGNFDAFWLNACSNLTIFGGDLTTTKDGNGILVNAPSHDVTWYDAYLHGIAGSGISVRGSTSSGVASNVYNLKIRAEVNGFAMNPIYDPHSDKGTGVHALILHGNTGGIHDSTFAIYGHDTLAPGGKSLTGVVYPEGTGGSVIEQGNDALANYNNDIMYAKGINLMMEPGHGTNPGSTGVQTGGNLFNLWGHIKLNGNVIGWAEATNTTGSVIHSDNGSWFPGSPALTVQHGRHSNTNQYTGGSNIPQPYPTTDPAGTPLGIVYQDCL